MWQRRWRCGRSVTGRRFAAAPFEVRTVGLHLVVGLLREGGDTGVAMDADADQRGRRPAGRPGRSRETSHPAHGRRCSRDGATPRLPTPSRSSRDGDGPSCAARPSARLRPGWRAVPATAPSKAPGTRGRGARPRARPRGRSESVPCGRGPPSRSGPGPPGPPRRPGRDRTWRPNTSHPAPSDNRGMPMARSAARDVRRDRPGARVPPADSKNAAPRTPTEALPSRAAGPLGTAGPV